MTQNDLIYYRMQKRYLWLNACRVCVSCEAETLLHLQVLVWPVLWDFFITMEGFFLAHSLNKHT